LSAHASGESHPILQWLLGYNFSVAVWVGYIALYGVAVQTGVVMVVYLHEALDKRLRRGDTVTEADIREATIAGSVLRLRPKLMTVSVVMAGLVPILWSAGVGSDIMNPPQAPASRARGRRFESGRPNRSFGLQVTYRRARYAAGATL
jgi:Cu/Ag efflux pump CusA